MIKIFNQDCLTMMQSQDFKDLIKDKKVCIVTDPPFNIKYHYNSYKDNLKEKEYYDFLKKVLTLYNFPFVIIHYPEYLYKLSFHIGKAPEKVVSWVYNSNTAKQHRDIAFFDIKPDFNKIKQPYKNPNDKRIKERIANGSKGSRLYDWWEINQVKNVSKKTINHPCVMPLEVMKRIIGILPEDIIILDPFMGCGTTAISCIEQKRHYIGFEINNIYIDVANKRIKEALDNIYLNGNINYNQKIEEKNKNNFEQIKLF